MRPSITSLHECHLYISGCCCDRLLSVGQNRYIQTKETVTFEQAKKLEALFTELYPEEPISGEGMNYYIRLKTLQVNSTIASNFLMKAMMIYGAIVLMVILFRRYFRFSSFWMRHIINTGLAGYF